MALRIRRGLEADRLSVTPDEGEYLYCTDTKLLYIGDGTTAGGNLISGAGAVVTASDTANIDLTVTGNDLTADLTDTTVTPSTYGDATNIPQITVDQKGRVTSVTDIPVSIPSGTVTSVGLTMPSAFTVANSPITSSGDIAVTGAGLVSQYVRGDGSLANFPASTGGGASLSFYLNGSVSQGTFGGVTYYEMNRTPILGLGTNFTLTNTNNYIASFLTDVGDPNQLNIPAGNWNCELYFNVSNNSGNPSFYIELYKYDGVTFTLIASSSTNPEFITNGTQVDLYTTAIPVPQTTLLATDRLAVRVHVNTSGNRTVTLHTEDNNLCQVITTFSTGLNALNGLTAQVQNFAVGTSGTDFAISSISPTHTFNLPTASATNRGALSSADWTTFNGKQNALGFTPENVANKQSALSTDVNHYYNAPYINTLPSTVLQRIFIASDQATTSNVQANITGLVTITLQANKTYFFRGIIAISSPAGVSGGTTLSHTIPSGSTSVLLYKGRDTTVAILEQGSGNGSTSFPLNRIANSLTDAIISGSVIVGANAGTVQFRFASGTNGQSTSIIASRTYIEIFEKL